MSLTPYTSRHCCSSRDQLPYLDCYVGLGDLISVLMLAQQTLSWQPSHQPLSHFNLRQSKTQAESVIVFDD